MVSLKHQLMNCSKFKILTTNPNTTIACKILAGYCYV